MECFAKETVAHMYEQASWERDSDRRKAQAAHATRSEAAARIGAMIDLSRSEEGIPVLPGQLDAQPYLLNVMNGTIDLRTGELREHRREDLITKLAPVAYDPEARCPLWDDFLERVLPDPEVRACFQRLVGHSACGDPREEKLPFVYGPPGSGKSTAMDAVAGALGNDYVSMADFSTFLAGGSSGPRNDIARLAGSRIVISLEVDDGKRFAEALVCQLVGGDTVSARFLYQEAFEFRPTFVPWLVANHRPHISSTDSPMWRRILLIPFDQAIPPEERDPEIKALLRNPEYAGAAVLAWIVEGALEWQRQGLNPPAPVLALTEEYRRESDPLREFLEERCTLDPSAQATNPEIWTAYQEWAKEAGEKYPLGRKRFSQALFARGLDQHTTGDTRYWIGLEVRKGHV